MKKNYTIFISSNNKQDSFKEFQISWKQIRIAIATGGLICALLAGFFADYMFSFSSYRNFEKHRLENQHLRAQLSKLQFKLKKIVARLQQMEDFSKKVKSIAGLEQHKISESSLLAVGPLTISETRGPVSDPISTTNFKNRYLQAALPSSFSKKRTPTASPTSPDAVLVYMDQWNHKSKMIHQDISLLLEQLYEKQDIFHSTPTIQPTRGWISSTFGYRKYPFNGGDISMHEGVDIATLPGTPVYAPGDGTIIFAGYKTGYGKLIIIDHGYQLSTLYGHLSDIMVSKWQKIKRKDVIAATGNTGYSSGPHLHYEIRISNVPVDPAKYILDDF